MEKKERVLIKYVRKAKMWCKTIFTRNDKGEIKQVQSWTSEKPII